MALALTVDFTLAAVLWPVLVGVAAGYFAYRQAVKVWLGALIGIAATFLAVLLLGGLLSVVVGLVVSLVVVYMIGQ